MPSLFFRIILFCSKCCCCFFFSLTFWWTWKTIYQNALSVQHLIIVYGGHWGEEKKRDFKRGKKVFSIHKQKHVHLERRFFFLGLWIVYSLNQIWEFPYLTYFRMWLFFHFFILVFVVLIFHNIFKRKVRINVSYDLCFHNIGHTLRFTVRSMFHYYYFSSLLALDWMAKSVEERVELGLRAK